MERQSRPNAGQRTTDKRPKFQPCKPIGERFWLRVDRRGPGECWEWKGSRHIYNGYGVFSIKRIAHHAHRVSWLINRGPIPEGLWVLHHCDNRPCVNPAHLYLGTVVENNRDMHARGRWRRAPWILARMAQTHCHAGHLFDSKNTGKKSNGTRFCKKCSALRAAMYRAAAMKTGVSLDRRYRPGRKHHQK